MKTVTPLGNRILIRLEPPKESEGRIIIPIAHREQPDQGRVLAKGSKVKDIAVGDVVLIQHYSATEVDYGTGRCGLVDAKHVVGKWEA